MLSAGIACCRIKRSRFHGRSIKRSTVERTPLSGSDGAERNVSSILCASLITAALYLHRARPAACAARRVCAAARLRSFSCYVQRALRDSYITIPASPRVALLSLRPVIIPRGCKPRCCVKIKTRPPSKAPFFLLNPRAFRIALREIRGRHKKIER